MGKADPSRRLAIELYSDLRTFEIDVPHHRTRPSAKSPSGEALKYIAKYWIGLRVFLADGRVGTDNNTVRRTIRPIASHDPGAENWATITSPVETCKLNAIEPHAYLTATITAIVNATNKAGSTTCCRGITPPRCDWGTAYGSPQQRPQLNWTSAVA